MATNAKGYNFKLKVDGDTFLGVTQDDLTITPKVKESITKDDAGVKQKEVTGQDIAFKVAGICKWAATGDTDVLDNDDIMELALKTGANAILDIEYVRDTGKAYEGTAIITGYSEGSPADPESDSSYSLDLAVIGTLSPVTSSQL